LLRRVAVFCALRRAFVIGVWLVVLVGVGFASHALGTQYSSSAEVAGSDSQAANDVMARSFSPELSDASPLVYHADSGSLKDKQNAAVVEESLKATAGAENVASVGELTYSKDGATAYAQVLPAQARGDMSVDEGEAIYETAEEPLAGSGVSVDAGGQLGTKISKSEGKTSELIGIAAAMLILVLIFGTVTAMVLPIAAAIFGLICGLSLVSLLGHLVAVPDVAPTVGAMIGLGVGIDYSLFIVTRARSARHEGMSSVDAIGHAAATSGSAVAFAGITVVIALLSLAVSGITLITVLGQAAAIVVVVAVLASMTLLPALLGLCGDRIERLRVGRDKRATLGHSALWQRWGARVSRRPGVFAVVSVLVLLVLSAPVRSLELGLTDQSSAEKSTTSRQAYDLMTENFGAGSNGPLLVTVDTADKDELAKLHDGLSVTEGVAAVGEPQVSKDGSAAIINVIPQGSPSSDATSALVDEVRDSVIPQSGVDAHVGGSTAQLLDLADLIAKRLPLIIAVVVGLSMGLLLVAFRSVVAPLQAALVNLLSVGAAYGIVTAVFQDGHGASGIGLDGAIPIVSFVPMMMFAILFGLSMDYQVFLLTRVREEYDRTGDTRQGVVQGLARTARVITSAALIMIFVFGAFVLNPTPEVKMFGLGLAFAVLVDATIVRMLLVPSIMEILGDANWWFPKWLGFLPRIDIEGTKDDDAPATPDAPDRVPAGV
jgi:RND superfamily putative drug exporter